jgi:hypothetical protein
VVKTSFRFLCRNRFSVAATHQADILRFVEMQLTTIPVQNGRRFKNWVYIEGDNVIQQKSLFRFPLVSYVFLNLLETAFCCWIWEKSHLIARWKMRLKIKFKKPGICSILISRKKSHLTKSLMTRDQEIFKKAVI